MTSHDSSCWPGKYPMMRFPTARRQTPTFVPSLRKQLSIFLPIYIVQWKVECNYIEKNLQVKSSQENHLLHEKSNSLSLASDFTSRISQGMLGTGRANVSEICDLARANVKDGLPSAALQAFSSLGSCGKHTSNQERDLHRWLRSLWGVKLSIFKVSMHLTVAWQQTFRSCLFIHVINNISHPFCW